jgi:hypothetical protein
VLNLFFSTYDITVLPDYLVLGSFFAQFKTSAPDSRDNGTLIGLASLAGIADDSHYLLPGIIDMSSIFVGLPSSAD